MKLVKGVNMEVLHLNKDNFKEEVMNYQGKVLIDFWAPWCSPCRMLGPVIEEVAEESTCKICKVNVDDEPELAQMFRVTSIPLLVVMENGKMVKSSLGYIPKEEVLQLLK